jgi:hypothetical protein
VDDGDGDGDVHPCIPPTYSHLCLRSCPIIPALPQRGYALCDSGTYLRQGALRLPHLRGIYTFNFPPSPRRIVRRPFDDTPGPHPP